MGVGMEENISDLIEKVSWFSISEVLHKALSYLVW